jgi:hypothetical protein
MAARTAIQVGARVATRVGSKVAKHVVKDKIQNQQQKRRQKRELGESEEEYEIAAREIWDELVERELGGEFGALLGRELGGNSEELDLD